MRKCFSDLLTQCALKDKRILLLTGDHGYALFDQFRNSCSDQFINCGIAEQNMVGVAAGLAKGGFIPIVYGLSAFVPIRVLEQIKIDVCYESLPVKFVGDGAGVVYSHLGATHQSTEDIAVLRAIPNIDIFSPADRFELEYCFTHMIANSRPTYLRFGKSDCGDIHGKVPTEPLGKLLKVRPGKANFLILATGSMVSIACKIADGLSDVTVFSIPVITLLNNLQLIDICRPFRKIFVLEEHSKFGGVGGMIAEILSEANKSGVVCIGTSQFSNLCGSYNYLMSYHHLNVEKIKEKILKMMTDCELVSASELNP